MGILFHTHAAEVPCLVPGMGSSPPVLFWDDRLVAVRCGGKNREVSGEICLLLQV